jgi:hypothetical protein
MLFDNISNMPFDPHHVHLKSCVDLGLGAWPFTHLIIPSFCVTFSIFSTILCIGWVSPHLVALGLTHCICGQLIDLVGIHFLWCSYGGECITFHDLVQDIFVSIAKNVGFHVSYEQHMFVCWMLLSLL